MLTPVEMKHRSALRTNPHLETAASLIHHRNYSILPGKAMPNRDAVATFVSLVESGQFIEAIRQFYHPAAIVWENHEKSRTGMDALIENEALVLRAFTTVHGRALHVMVDGDNVAINWRFEFSNNDTRLSLDEIAYQQWSDGKITYERFYYDPSQLRPSKG